MGQKGQSVCQKAMQTFTQKGRGIHPMVSFEASLTDGFPGWTSGESRPPNEEQAFPPQKWRLSASHTPLDNTETLGEKSRTQVKGHSTYNQAVPFVFNNTYNEIRPQGPCSNRQAWELSPGSSVSTGSFRRRLTYTWIPGWEHQALL